MSTYDPETSDWKERAENKEIPFAFQSHNLVDLTSAIGEVQNGEFTPVKEITKDAWLQLRAVNRSVRLRSITATSSFKHGFAAWSNRADVNDEEEIKREFRLSRTNPGDKYYYTQPESLECTPQSRGFDSAHTEWNGSGNPLESNFYCVPRADEVSVSSSSDIDIGILTIRPEEYMAVLDRLSDRWQVNKRREIYECATIRTSNGSQMNVTVARCLAQGNLESSIITNQLLEEVKPRWILLVGIAGGLPANEFSLGDVLIASRYLDFSVTGAIEGLRVEQNVSGGGFHSDVEKLLKHLPADREALTGWSSTESLNQNFPPVQIPSAVGDPLLYGDDKWQSTVLKSLQHHFGSGPRPPQAHIGPTGSANVLMKDTELAKQWLSTARSIVNVEMELAGVYKACCAYNSELPKLLAIRGISDVIGYKRSHEWLNYACHSAAAFTISMIQAGLLQNAEAV